MGVYVIIQWGWIIIAALLMALAGVLQFARVRAVLVWAVALGLLVGEIYILENGWPVHINLEQAR